MDPASSLVRAIDVIVAVGANLEVIFNTSAGSQRAIEFRHRSALDRHAVKINNAVRFLFGCVNDRCAVGADLITIITNIPAGSQRAIEFRYCPPPRLARCKVHIWHSRTPGKRPLCC